MAQQLNISGPGVGLPVNQFYYPSELANAPQDVGTNYISLAPGDSIVLQAGTQWVSMGAGLFLQYLDPTTGIWRGDYTNRQSIVAIPSDGFTRRVLNQTGCPIAAVVTAGGSGYTQSTCTVTASAGGSTWQPIVGGMLSVNSITNAGANYTVPPLILIPAPPNPGVPATAYAILTGGSVTTVSLTNVGAGYTSAPTATIVPAPNDVNYLSGTTAITNATVQFALVGTGSIAAVLLTNPGAPVSTAPTLTAAGGAGTGASITAVLLQTVTGTSIGNAGAGYGTAAEITTINGEYTGTAETYVNPAIQQIGFIPRKAVIGPATLVGGSITAVGSIIDGGLFVSAPTAVVVGNGVATTASTVTLTMGSAPYTLGIQSL